MTPESKSPGAPPPAEVRTGLLRLPVRASIYIDRDGSVHFGALFADLVPVARALGHPPESDSAQAATPACSTGVDQTAPAFGESPQGSPK